ncbi:MAG: hypothetical protein EA361_12350 [Bacteroidetes bacterium]|nr:MAG: hypothetical protein EA361_12350 [Bacteroidota bacterium]
MRYLLIAWFLIVTFTQSAYSQRWTRERHHLIVGLGGSGFMGDLGGADDIGTQGIRDFDFSAVRPAFMLGYRYMLFQNIGITGNLSFGYVSGDDKYTEETFRNNRNIHFRSPILELSSTVQVYLLRLDRQGARYRSLTGARVAGSLGLSAYLFAGVGGFYFNPQGYFEGANYTGNIPTEELPADGWYNLRPLRTEGQGFFETRDQYSPFSIAIPFGLGAMIQINRDISIGFQYGFRKTFTDYIDDVSTTYVDPAIYSIIFEDPARVALAEYFANPTNNQLSKNVTAPGQQRGNPFNTDAYMFGFITVYYKIPDFRRPYGVLRF